MAMAIEIDYLSRYDGEKRAIDRVNLRVEEGEVFGFIGPNGAGKTTTIRTLLELIFPSGGSARVFGMDSHEQSEEIKRNVGYLPSEEYFYKSMTGRQPVNYSARLSGLASSP